MIETVSVQEVINFNEKLHSSSEEEYQYLNKRVVFVDSLKREITRLRATNTLNYYGKGFDKALDDLSYTLFGEASTKDVLALSGDRERGKATSKKVPAPVQRLLWLPRKRRKVLWRFKIDFPVNHKWFTQSLQKRGYSPWKSPKNDKKVRL